MDIVIHRIGPCALGWANEGECAYLVLCLFGLCLRWTTYAITRSIIGVRVSERYCIGLLGIIRSSLSLECVNISLQTKHR